jgi:hypothetical protein
VKEIPKMQEFGNPILAQKMHKDGELCPDMVSGYAGEREILAQDDNCCDRIGLVH